MMQVLAMRYINLRFLLHKECFKSCFTIWSLARAFFCQTYSFSAGHWHVCESALVLNIWKGPMDLEALSALKTSNLNAASGGNWSVLLDHGQCVSQPERITHSFPLLTPGWDWSKQQLVSMHHVCCQECDHALVGHSEMGVIFKNFRVPWCLGG